MVVQVRYYEVMYLITDKNGIRVYTGNDEKVANSVLSTLNGYQARKRMNKKKVTRKKK